MPDFSDIRTELVQARAARDAADAAAAQAVEEHRALTAQRDRLARSVDANDPAALAEQTRLDEAAKQAEGRVAVARAEAQRANEASATALDGFAVFSDPRENVTLLSDRSPFALFPVRLETRFVTQRLGERATHQLWVRIYPDDCSIDTFEAVLSTAELSNAKRYWRDVWRAGGIEAGERAAWRGLVAAHGSGRAAWIADTYQPTNLAQRPTKVAGHDEILVIPTQSLPSTSEAQATVAYWEATWQAGDDIAGRSAARAALDGVVGPARAGELIAAYVPFNLSDAPTPPLKRTNVAVAASFLVFPPDPPTKQNPWSRAPHVGHFPERFVVLAYSSDQLVLQAIGGVVSLPLYVGPDPSADPSDGIHPDGADLFVPDRLRWMFDFDRAVAAGVGIAMDITPQQAARGFDRLLVVGLQMSASHTDGKAVLEDLLRHHAVGRSGLSLVPQGTPTHNTSGRGTAYTRLDDADQSFDDRKGAPLFSPNSDATRKRDGQWVAELLGIDPTLLTSVHGSGGQDQMQVRAMQRALWPATLGYWMDKMLAPVFSDEAVEATRWFFTQYVSGRGAVPALRMGGQPYGILPTTAFSRIRWLEAQPPNIRGDIGRQLDFLAELLKILRKIDQDWTAMTAGVAHVGKPGDPHQTLLDVVGLHPASVEFHSRYAESLAELFNVVNLWGIGPDFWQALLAIGLEAAGADLLANLGYTGATEPDILQHVFLKDATQIHNVIDDRPLSETEPVRVYTPDGRNYLHWLIDAAKTSLDALTAEEGFTKNASPQTLLYLYLRHALMLGYYDSSYALHRAAGFLTATELAGMKPEPAFVHVADQAAQSESRFAALLKTEPRITNSANLLVSDYITLNLGDLLETAGLAEQLEAVRILADASTAQLERAFAEHIDVCSYRFDAWLLGLVNFQLAGMRFPLEGKDVNTGVYLGAYAWLEDLRPSAASLERVQLPTELEKVFGGPSPLMHDSANGGYIHAPSIPHSRTAAVLRSGYLANATPGNPQTMAVNLSSDRVRLALSVLEGIRNGQSLGALLGYRFERALHDDHSLAEVDKFIYPMRKAFPLVADALATTRSSAAVPIEAIEARNVLDGRKLIARVHDSGIVTYPFGLATLPPATAPEAAAINAEVNAMLDVYDAIADLALAEGVHQAVQGNFERIGATLDAYTTGNFPPDPEVAQTPAAGVGLTHRVAVHFEQGLGPAPDATPRAQAAPALDAWLAGILPLMGDVGCSVLWTDPVGGAHRQRDVTLADLAVRPIDVLDLLKPDNVQAMTELDDRILRFVIETAKPRPDATLQIRYMTAPTGKLSLFQISPLVRRLNMLVARSRPLRATDATLHNDATPEQDADVFVDRGLVSQPAAQLDALSADIALFLGTLVSLLADPIAHRDAIVGGIDVSLEAAASLLERAARFNIPQSGWGFAYEWRRKALIDLFAKVGGLVSRWNQRVADFDAMIIAYDALPAATSDADRFKALQAVEDLVQAAPDPLPAAPATLRAALDVKRNAFVTRHDQLAAVLAAPHPSLSRAIAAVDALLPVTTFDRQPFEISKVGDSALIFAEDVVANLTGCRAEVDTRRAKVQVQLAAHDAATSTSAKVQALQAAAQAMLGEEFRLIPEFALASAQADEWANAVAGHANGSLLSYLTTTAKIDFPVDEWLSGVARVRPMVQAWESTVILASALGRPEPSLVPIQLPYEAAAPWVGMQFPPSYVLDSDRLLYTAHYSTPFNKAVRQCGLLLDEWTEVIPATTRTTGLTFNFARPDNEAPQSILLVTPATANGSWQWDDIVGALNETLDLAKKRAVEPVHLDNTAYSRFLPATIMAATLYGISITTILAAANGVISYLEASENA